MTKRFDIDEVAVLSEDGRTERLATFHGWEKRQGENGLEWWGHVKVFTDDGQRWETLPAARLIPLVYCGRLPDGEIRHSDECRAQADGHLGAG